MYTIVQDQCTVATLSQNLSISRRHLVVLFKPYATYSPAERLAHRISVSLSVSIYLSLYIYIYICIYTLFSLFLYYIHYTFLL